MEDNQIPESKGKKWFQDSGGKQSPKRIMGVVGTSIVLLVYLISGFDFYNVSDAHINIIPAMLGVFAAMLAVGGLTKGG